MMTWNAREVTTVSMIDTVLFDVGGVLTFDPWETMVLTPTQGLADRLRIPRPTAEAAGVRLWPRFSLRSASEADYWRQFSALVNRDVEMDIVASVRKLIVANPCTAEALAIVQSRTMRWGVISDNTAFWFPQQLALLGISIEDDALTLLSYEQGRSKSSEGIGLFELAAEKTVPRRTLVIDDRDHNLRRAQAVGFATARYSFYDDPDGRGLLELVKNSTE
ncbi:HAD family hydrolase [Hamadaea tsunoensis]|uniref:HAD family hydrolase n=1 Tax=Hamadaea tsunoensis TaxID=53368 RepID=UPI00048A4178|nr:hypothetical protein [Hamadaea tsunoensis]